jgi:DNA invertase Pin-like site-specific DNA recombinase
MAQELQVKAFAERAGYKILRIEQDTASGKGSDALERRPGLMAAVAAAKAHKCPIIVAGIDRLARQVSVYEDIAIAMGVKIFAISIHDSDYLARCTNICNLRLKKLRSTMVTFPALTRESPVRSAAVRDPNDSPTSTAHQGRS